MNYYIADMHLGHANILKFDNRPFKTVQEMNKVLIDNWNKRVKKNDTVYILGDFCWGKEAEWIDNLNKLMGRKVLIRGNHDLKQMSRALKDKFVTIKERYEISDCSKKIIMSHFPEMAYKSSYSPNVFMFHGHVHCHTGEAAYIRKWVQELRENRVNDFDNRGQIINVGCMVEGMDYTPRTLAEILQMNGYS